MTDDTFRFVFRWVFLGAIFLLLLDGLAILLLPAGKPGVEAFEAACTWGFGAGTGACFGLFGGRTSRI